MGHAIEYADFEFLAEGREDLVEYVRHLLDVHNGCIRKQRSRYPYSPDKASFMDMLRECVEREGGGLERRYHGATILILNGDEDMSKYPDAILIVPECTDASITRNLSIDTHCSREGNPLAAIVFATPKWSQKMKTRLERAWAVARILGVGLITEYIIH